MRQDVEIFENFEDEKNAFSFVDNVNEKSLLKLHAFSLSDIMRKSASPPNYNDDQLVQLDEVHLNKIAKHAPVNTLMLDYYLEQLIYQPVFLKAIDSKCGDNLEWFNRNSGFNRNSVALKGIKLKKQSVKIEEEYKEENPKEDCDWILIQLRMTLMLLAHVAIYDAKLGKPILHWLDRMKYCYNQIKQWNQNEERKMLVNATAHHIQYAAYLLGYKVKDVQTALANPGIGLLKIENFEGEPTFSTVKDHLQSQDAVFLINEKLYYAHFKDSRLEKVKDTEHAFYNKIKAQCLNNYKTASYNLSCEIRVICRFIERGTLKTCNLLEMEKSTEEIDFNTLNGRDALISIDGSLYYANFINKSLKKIIKKDDNEQYYNELLTACRNKNKLVQANKEELIKIQSLTDHLRLMDEIKLTHFAGKKFGKIRLLFAFWMPISEILFALTKLISNCFLYAKRLQKILEKPDRRSDTASLILNLLLFPLRLGLFLYALVDSRKESKLPFKERLKKAWGDHGVDLLRSLFLSAVNCLIYFWLHGAGKLDFIGKITNVSALAGVEIVLGLIKGVFAAIDYRANLRDMNATLNKLLPLKENQQKDQFIHLNKLITASNEEIINIIDKSLKTQQLKDDEFETRRKQVWAIIHVARKAHVEYIAKRNIYIILTLQGLMNAMATAIVMFQLFPLLLGPIFYVASSVFNNLATSANEIYKIGKAIDSLQLEYELNESQFKRNDLVQQIKQLSIQFIKSEQVTLKSKVKIFTTQIMVYDNKKLELEKDIIFQHALRDYQKIVAVTNTIFDAAVAIGLFAMFTFLPFGIVPIAIAVGVMLAVLITKTVAEKCFKDKIIEVRKVSHQSMFTHSKSKDEINDLGDKEDLVLN